MAPACAEVDSGGAADRDVVPPPGRDGDGMDGPVDQGSEPLERPGPLAPPPPPLAGDNDAGTDESAECGSFRAESQFEPAPVDVIWAIDNSPSMLPSVPFVADGMTQFTSSVESSGRDMRIVMLSSFINLLPPAIMQDTERFLLRPTDVQSSNAFDVLLFDFPNYEPFLRPNAVTHIVVVSDFFNTLPRASFRMQMESRLGHEFVFHAVADPLVSVDYYELARETGGVMLPIAGDWNVVFDELEEIVVTTAQLPCDAPLEVGDDADFDNVQVRYVSDGDGRQLPRAADVSQCGTEDAWYFDDPDDPTTVVLCPDTCERVREQSGSLDIVVGCEPPPEVVLL